MLQQALKQQSPLMASLIEVQTFGFATYRKRHGLYSFKLTKNQKFKNNHAMSLKKRQTLQKMGYEGELRIKDTERTSDRPFGQLDSRGRFRFRIEKVPFYNIPDLTGFNLLPYVSHNTPQIDYKLRESRRVDLDPEYLERINKRIGEQITEGIIVREEAEGVSETGAGAKLW